MANFKQINKAVKKAFPDIQVEVVRGEGYVYYVGEGDFDYMESLMLNPTSVDTETMLRFVMLDIEDRIKEINA